jgi:hypothetical protein
MDEQGIANICQRAESYSGIAKLYQPTESMRKMAKTDIKFYP